MDSDHEPPPFSPSAATSCSSPGGDSDTLQTPLNENTERHTFPPHVTFDYAVISPSMEVGDLVDSQSDDGSHYLSSARLSPLSHLFGVQSPDNKHSTDNDAPNLQSHSRDMTNTSLEIDPFAVSFGIAARRNEALYGSHSSNYVQDTPSLLWQPSYMNTYTKPMLARSSLSKYYSLNRNGRAYSERFPVGHLLDKRFVNEYQLEDQLGSGGYGFVMTAHHRAEGREVAVKFIIKEKVPENAWMETEEFGRPLPTEIVILSYIDHENIVKCLDLFEDALYFYLVQELHGTPWHKKSKKTSGPTSLILNAHSVPSLTPSASIDSIADTNPVTPPSLSVQFNSLSTQDVECQPEGGQCLYDMINGDTVILRKPIPKQHSYLQSAARPEFSRRASHDLFECIEQSKHKRLPEKVARYIFAQVVEAVHYLDSLGITHRDLKDENLVADKNYKVKLIDFGSAIVSDPNEPRPYHTLFFGTTAYASSEILRKQPYQAPPAEIWTLGILMSYLLTGMSPFPMEKDAIEGRITLKELPGVKLPDDALDLMRRCLEPEPKYRATIQEVQAHPWVVNALDDPPV